MGKEKILILGAAGRDFHNFNTVYRDNEKYEVVAFTATQIPNIEDRKYPAVLAGKLYPEGIKIYPEDDLEKLVKDMAVDTCVLAYSDLNHLTVMEIASRVLATGANFALLGPRDTMVQPKKPCFCVVAVRTGCGKSQTSRYCVRELKKKGLTVGVIRHPMPYGDLAKQAVQRFANYKDLDDGKVTIEEREEYEKHIDDGSVVYAGVDFEKILRLAESENDVILWDGGNNDLPFYNVDLFITVADPHRPGHEHKYYPGAVNFRMADVIVVAKSNTADKEAIESVKASAAKYNPKAKVVVHASEVFADKAELIKGKKVLLIEDGPTLTHGEMMYGAGKVAADKYGAAEIIDPTPYLVGSMKGVFEKYTHIKNLLPCMGYWDEQVRDMEATVAKVPCDTVIIGTPMDLKRLIKINQDSVVVTYESEDMKGEQALAPLLKEFIEKCVASKQ